MKARLQSDRSNMSLWAGHAGSESAQAIPVAKLLMPSNTEVGIVAFATLLAASAYFGLTDSFEWVNYLVPTILILGLGWGIFQMAMTDITSIWTPLFWNRVVLIVYFGIGSIVPAIVNDPSRTVMEAFYHFFPEDINKYNLIIGVFVLSFLIFVKIVVNFSLRKKYLDNNFEESNLDQKTVGIILLSVGASILTFLIAPNTFGYINIKIPTIIAEISQGLYIGIYFLTLWALKNRSKSIYIILIFVIILFLYGVLELNKSSAIFPLLMFVVGFIYHKPSAARFFGGFLILITIFMTISSPVSHGRNYGEFIRTTDDAINFDVRYKAILSYYDENNISENDNQLNSGWMRLSYVNAGTFAISQYDTGNPGNSLDNIFILWIPRLIYPEKPIITDIARDFNYAATGSYDSQSSPGVIAESYWSFGWIGVFTFSTLLAIVSTLWSIYAVDVMRSKAWHLFFIVLLGMRSASRLDGMIVPDVVGPIGYAVLGHVVLQFLNRMIAKQRLPRRVMAA